MKKYRVTAEDGSYVEYATQEEVPEGQTAEEIEFELPVNPAKKVPKSVTQLQMRRTLRSLGLLNSVIAAVQGAGDEAVEAWDYALTFDRDDDTVNQIGASLGLTPDQIDDIYITAENI